MKPKRPAEPAATDWVPPWEGWPVTQCAVRGCPFPRIVEKLRGRREVVRRYCQRHCTARMLEIVDAGPAPVLVFHAPTK